MDKLMEKNVNNKQKWKKNHTCGTNHILQFEKKKQILWHFYVFS